MCCNWVRSGVKSGRWMLDCGAVKELYGAMVLLVVGTSSDISNVSSAQPSPAQPSPVQPSPAQPLKLKVKITIDCRCLPTSPSFLMLSTSFMCVSNWRGDCRDGIIIPAIVSRNVACKAVMTSAHSSRRLTFWKQLSCLVTIQWIPSSLLLRCTMCPEFADCCYSALCQGRKLEFVQVAPLQRLRSIKMTSSCLLPPDHTGAATGDICGDHWQPRQK